RRSSDLESLYDRILERGETEWHQGKVRPKVGTKGRKPKSPGANLGERFRVHKPAILRFLRDAQVPFDNNLAERDLRMSKVKQKDRKSTRLNSSHVKISYAVFCLKKTK